MTASKKQKACISIFFSDYTEPRGGEKFLFELSKRLIKKYQLSLFVERISPYWTQRYLRIGVHIQTLWRPNHVYWGLLPISMVVNFFALRNKIKKTDSVFAATFPLTFLATLLSKKTVLFCFEPLNIFYDSVYAQSLSFFSQMVLFITRHIYRPFDNAAMKKGGVIATLNSFVETDIIKQYGRPADYFIPIGVDAHFFSSKAKPLFNYKKRGFFVIGHSTDYTPLKGTDYLLRALPSAIQQNPLIFVIISESISNPKKKREYKRMIKNLQLQKHVLFVGCLKEQDLPKFYTACSIYCFCGSSRSVSAYSASLSVLESQACGTPVLRTKGNINELREGKTGFFISPEDTLAFTKTIVSFSKMKDSSFVKMQLLARRYASSFSWDTSVHKLEDAIQKTSTLPRGR